MRYCSSSVRVRLPYCSGSVRVRFFSQFLGSCSVRVRKSSRSHPASNAKRMKELNEPEPKEPDYVNDPEQDSDNEGNDAYYALPAHIAQSSVSKGPVKLKAFARACDRYGIGDRPTAALASSLLHDADHNRDENEKLNLVIVIDNNKVRRARAKNREDTRLQQLVPNMKVSGLYFDGRKDVSKVLKMGEDGKWHPGNLSEEHISLVQEPGSNYLDHVTPVNGTAKVIRKLFGHS